MMLGKLRPREDLRTFKLSTYASLLPAAPEESDWSKKLVNLGPMLNNDVGDCTCAGPGHAIETWTAANGKQITPSDAEVLAMYIAISKYDPSNPATDRGAYAIDALNYWRKTGLGGRKIDAYAQLTLKNRDHVKQSIHYFGGVYLGIWMPLSAQGQTKWHIALGGTEGDPSSASWGGHVVWGLGYSAYGVLCVSWGQFFWMSWSFFDTNCDEAYVCLSRLWADADGAPSSKVYDELLNALPSVAS